ncbi:hypothetical protein FHS88_003417 [Roseomonas alkaliterrae]|uniref:Uncharacterized protein n=2 Tax=Neoroseomonas alkaliterrae TaxID=1452450 RepID=A0A840YBL1_9PROT|nr:hypothetical protein [Neoroseomonas alkaliterrae]MBB5691264.1 hypothetical protein [Neoroseomonas alkaliterrae]
MILGFLFVAGAVGLVLMAVRELRAARRGDWVRAEGTRLVIGPLPGQDEPRMTLQRDRSVAFGPYWATWDPPAGMTAVPAPVRGSGSYRVLAAVDLSGEDAFGTGDARLARTLAGALGRSALILAPEQGDSPILLHGTTRGARGSAAGIGVEQAQLDRLIELVGDPVGLRVEIERRRVQRAGWGGAQAHRHRARG